MTEYVTRKIINGSLLRAYNGQYVSVHVNVEEEVDRFSKLIKGKTTDDVEVKIQLAEPLNVPIKGWIEVIGIPNGPDIIRNKEVITFNDYNNKCFNIVYFDFYCLFLLIHRLSCSIRKAINNRSIKPLTMHWLRT